jgi:hypothetical protein
MRTLAVVAIAMGLAACGEIPQDGPKPFVEANGQKAAHAQALAERTATQDDYQRIKD